MYLTYEEFNEMYPAQNISEDEFASLEQRAETDVNGLTFNRICKQGFEMLSDFQKSIVRRCTALQVIFVHENSELLDSPLSAYSISGVSMSFDKDKIIAIGSVTTSKVIYGSLMQTGLCYGGVC